MLPAFTDSGTGVLMTEYPALLTTALSRRDLLRRSALAGLGLAGVGALAGCSDSNSNAAASGTGASASATGPLKGHLEFLNYPQWIGPHEISDFERAHPGVSISQNDSAYTNSISGVAVTVAQDPSQFDMLLGDLSVVGQLQAGGFVAQFDFDRIPNIALVEPTIRHQYPKGIPTDFGKMGIGYRKDLVKPAPRSWHDLWEMAPRYSGKIVAYNLDRDMLGPALKYLGYSVNTRVDAQWSKAKDALIELKKYIKAFKAVDIASELVHGQAVIAITNDYDVALAQTQNSNIAWVVPSEGTSGYLEGIIGVSRSQHIPVVEAFSNFHLAPPNYASFVATTATSYTEPKIRSRLPKDIADSKTIGAFDLDDVEFEHYLGEATTQYVSNMWEQVEAA
jgi:spermidine/putrescine transport system substrate-binding protein